MATPSCSLPRMSLLHLPPPSRTTSLASTACGMIRACIGTRTPFSGFLATQLLLSIVLLSRLHMMEIRGLGHAQNPIWALEGLFLYLLLLFHLLTSYSYTPGSHLALSSGHQGEVLEWVSGCQRQIAVIHSHNFLLERRACWGEWAGCQAGKAGVWWCIHIAFLLLQGCSPHHHDRPHTHC